MLTLGEASVNPELLLTFYPDSLRKEIYRRECEIILFFQIISVADWENDRSGRWRIWGGRGGWLWKAWEV